MTFEEFFKKKKIDLTALQAGEFALFSEFKTNFGEMGEKSFDHSKKYWFNKLRHQFPLAPEVKTEKAAIANPLAEQTITESLIEGASVTASPKLGFAPKFKAANMPKPAVAAEEKKEYHESALPVDEDTPAETPKPEPAYKPRFKMKNIPPKDIL